MVTDKQTTVPVFMELRPLGGKSTSTLPDWHHSTTSCLRGTGNPIGDLIVIWPRCSPATSNCGWDCIGHSGAHPLWGKKSQSRWDGKTSEKVFSIVMSRYASE